MSLILDALNKADRENRQPDSSPSLDTEHELPDSDDLEKSSNHKLVFSGVIVVIIIAICLFWFLGDSDKKAPEQYEPSVVNGESKSAKSSEKSSSTNTLTKSDKSMNAESQRTKNKNVAQEKKLSRNEELKKRYIEAQYEEQKKRISETDMPKSTSVANIDDDMSAASKAATSTKKNRQISGLYTKTETTQDVSSIKETASVERNQGEENKDTDEKIVATTAKRSNSNKKARTTDRDIEQAIREFQNTGQSKVSTPKTKEPEINDDTVMAFYTDIGSIRDLPFSAQEKIPSIMYSNHQYSGSRKSVEMNGKQYRENSKVGSDLTIEKILRDGVILHYQEYKFKMSAYNNWINL